MEKFKFPMLEILLPEIIPNTWNFIQFFVTKKEIQCLTCHSSPKSSVFLLYLNMTPMSDSEWLPFKTCFHKKDYDEECTSLKYSI